MPMTVSASDLEKAHEILRTQVSFVDHEGIIKERIAKAIAEGISRGREEVRQAAAKVTEEELRSAAAAIINRLRRKLPDPGFSARRPGRL
jgi:hypothetical protein